jgi:N-acetylglucosaminyldiphosphoundecaprenol N-acetyl-beta-D-mannosaminyltransferase
MRAPKGPTVRLGGVDITTLGRSDLVDRMLAAIDAHRKGETRRPEVVVDANGHGVSLNATDAAYRADVAAADLVHADGGFLVTLSRLTPTPIPERSATTDLIHDAAAAASKHGFSFYLLGATEEVNRECAETLVREYPGLSIAGRQDGFFQDLDRVAEDIRTAKPDVLWVGMGKPLEQRISLQLRDRTSVPWIVTCGGCFNFVVGAYRRAPGWMQRANLEWLHRLLSDPRKLFWRYAVTSPHALLLVLPDLLRAWTRRGPRRA